MARMTCPCGATFERTTRDLSEVVAEKKWMRAHEPHPAMREAALQNLIETREARADRVAREAINEDMRHKCEREGSICPGHAGYNAWFCDDGRGRG